MEIDVLCEKGRYYILKENEKISIHKDVIIKYRLLGKKDVTPAYFEEIKHYALVVEGYYLARSFLTRPRAIKEVREYLKEKEAFDEEIINVLCEQHYLDDLRYAEDYLDFQKKQNKKGPKLIFYELAQKGVPSEIISTLDYGSEEENVRRLVEVMDKKIKNKSSIAKKRHIEDFLYKKGYTSFNVSITNNDDDIIEKEYLKLEKRYLKYDDKQRHEKIKRALYNKGFLLENIENCLKKND